MRFIFTAFVIFPLLFGLSYARIRVKEGYACVSQEGLDDKTIERLRTLLSEAKKKKKGLWKDFSKIMNCLCR